VHHHDGSGNNDDTTVSDVDGMSIDVSGLVGLGVDERARERILDLVSALQSAAFYQVWDSRDDSSSVTKRDDDRGGNSLLQGTSTVVGSPRNDDGDKRVDTGGGQEETSVLDVGVLASQQEQESDHTQRGEGNGNDTTLLETVGRPSGNDSGESGNNVGRNRHLRR